MIKLRLKKENFYKAVAYAGIVGTLSSCISPRSRKERIYRSHIVDDATNDFSQFDELEDNYFSDFMALNDKNFPVIEDDSSVSKEKDDLDDKQVENNNLSSTNNHQDEVRFIESPTINPLNPYSCSEFCEQFDRIYKSSKALQENWGNIYPELYAFISRYGDYLMQEEVLRSLETLKFVRADNISDYGTVVAKYNYNNNTIYYSDSLFHKKGAEIKELQLHEAFHFLFQNNMYYSSSNPAHHGLFIDEGIVSLLVRESDSYANVDAYWKQAMYTSALMEIVGVDNYMRAVGAHDYAMFINILSQYCSESEASSLVSYIDEAVLHFRNKGTKEDIKAWEIIHSMYEKKNGITIEESHDEIMKIYSNELSRSSYNIEGAEYRSDAHANKRYLLNCKENSIILKNTSLGEFGKIILDENNSVVEVVRDKTK